MSVKGEIERQVASDRRPGRPPAGANGSHVASYPKVRVEPDVLEKCRALAKDQGEPLHVVVSKLLQEGLG